VLAGWAFPARRLSRGQPGTAAVGYWLRGNPRLGIHGEISDSFLLTEPQPGTTRLIRRMRLSCGPWPFRAYAVPVVLIWGEAITARNLLRGIKRRAETTRPQD
jgi:hypothetical protein